MNWSTQNNKTSDCVHRDSYEIDISNECMEAARRWGGSQQRRETMFWVMEAKRGNFSTVFKGVDNGVDNGSPPKLPHGHGVFEGGQLGGQWNFLKSINGN